MADIMTVSGYAQMFESSLPSFVPLAEHAKADMRDMMLYSLESGGKRVRPVLCLAFCELCGGNAENALAFAAAVEFVHTYSLIHDDLPCMDNDDYRRGKLASHKKYGESNALLAGDALLTHAFSLFAQAVEQKKVSADAAIKAVGVLASCAGVNGMIGGQFVDLAMENRESTIDDLFLMDRYKTAALIKAACQLGCIAADASDEMIEKAGLFAENLGIAFQIIDDLLDDEDETSSDKVNNKATYPALLGERQARQLAEEYTKKAVEALSAFGKRSSFLQTFALQLVNRKV